MVHTLPRPEYCSVLDGIRELGVSNSMQTLRSQLLKGSVGQQWSTKRRKTVSVAHEVGWPLNALSIISNMRSFRNCINKQDFHY